MRVAEISIPILNLTQYKRKVVKVKIKKHERLFFSKIRQLIDRITTKNLSKQNIQSR